MLALTHTMKTMSALLALQIGFAFSIAAQGVLLGPGDSLSFGFDRVNGCQRLIEPLPPEGLVFVRFGNNLLDPSESLRIEMFENNLSETPIAVQMYAPASSLGFVSLESLNAWGDYQGLIRLTMLSGSVQVDAGRFIVLPDPFTSCETIVPVPEPGVNMLAILSGFVFATWRGIHRNCRKK